MDTKSGVGVVKTKTTKYNKRWGKGDNAAAQSKPEQRDGMGGATMFAGCIRQQRGAASVEGFDDGRGMTRPLPATATGATARGKKG
jgi:hypothetical protein